MSQIEDGKVGIFHYTLTNEEGTVLDSSEGNDPLAYLHGYHNIVPGLESQLTGKSIGDKFVAVVLPKDGYGEMDPEGFVQVPEEQMPEGIQFQAGMQMMAEGEDGHPVPVWMDDYQDGIFTMNFNHPLAGVTLIFNVEIVGVRDALEVELQHGHPHGIDGTGGHHHDH